MGEALTTENPTENLIREYGRLNSLWTAAEKQLADLNTPVECYHIFECKEDGDCHLERMLGWVKFRNKWKLCLGCRVVEQDEFWWCPVLECSIDDRVEAVEAFPEVRRKLESETAGFLIEVRLAADSLSNYVKHF